MTTFILVHGAWYGPWAWERVTPLLHEAGIRTVTPTLTLEGDAGLDTHVQELLTVLDDEAAADGDVVLVGHSYAGLVVRQAADQRPGQVSHIMMIDGWAGGDGESLFSLAPDAFVTAISRGARARADGRHVPARSRNASASPIPRTPAGWRSACDPSRCAPSPRRPG